MKNHKPSNWFWSPLFGWSGFLSFPTSVISLLYSWPPVLQFFLCFMAMVFLIAKLVYVFLPHINKLLNDRTNRRIREADAQTMRPTREQTFNDAFSQLLSHAPQMSDSQYLASLKLITKFYVVEDSSTVDENMLPQNNIVYLSSSAPPIINSPPEIHTLSNKKRRN